MDGVLQDVVSALKALGYKPTEAKMMAKSAILSIGDDAPMSTLVKEALKKPSEMLQDEPEGEVESETALEGSDASQAKPAKGNRHLDIDPEFLESMFDIQIAKPTPVPKIVEKQLKKHFHWTYFLLLGWWLTVLVVLLRFIMLGVDSLFRVETKKEPRVSSLFGWW